MYYEQRVRTHLSGCGLVIIDANLTVYWGGRAYTAHDGRFAPEDTVGGPKTVLEIRG